MRTRCWPPGRRLPRTPLSVTSRRCPAFPSARSCRSAAARARSPRPRWSGRRSTSPRWASSAWWCRCRGTIPGSRYCRGPRRPSLSPSPRGRPRPACRTRRRPRESRCPRPRPPRLLPRAGADVRALIAFVFVAVAVVAQLTVVDRIAFPGGAGPDLVLLAVAALALASGPMAGALIGFWAGLALDVAPPGSHFVGQDALVFCVIGYACGLAADVPNSEGVPEQGHTALFEIVVTAIGAVLGEALASLLGAMLSDPRVTWAAIKYVLPVAIVYDVLLCPFVLYACAAALRLAGAPRGERSRAAWSMLAAGSSAGATQGAIRQ